MPEYFLFFCAAGFVSMGAGLLFQLGVSPALFGCCGNDDDGIDTGQGPGNGEALMSTIKNK